MVGDWVCLWVLHRPLQSLLSGPSGKLGPRYARPYQVAERIGPSPIALSCRRVPAFMMCSTSGSSRPSRDRHHQLHRPCRCCTTVVYSNL